MNRDSNGIPKIVGRIPKKVKGYGIPGITFY